MALYLHHRKERKLKSHSAYSCIVYLVNLCVILYHESTKDRCPFFCILVYLGKHEEVRGRTSVCFLVPVFFRDVTGA